jgi:hypothetical protein
LSNIVRLHPDLLDVSEFFACQNVRAFYQRRFDGEVFWRRLSRPQRTIRATIPPTTNEFSYPLERGTFTDVTLPPILRVTLARMVDDCDALYRALEPTIRARPVAPAADHYEFLFSWLCATLGKSMWVERSGASAMMLPAILSDFERAKIVHVVRDGRESALSMADHPAFRLLLVNYLRWGKIGQKMMDDCSSFGHGPKLLTLFPLVEQLVSPQRDAQRAHPPRAYGEMWNEIVWRALDRVGEVPPHRRLTLSYEGLVRQPASVIERFAEFLGARLDADWIARAAVLPSPRRSRFEALGEEERNALQCACWPSLERLGYPPLNGPVGTSLPTRLPA